MIRRFQEKPAPGTEFSNLINAGCYLIEREVLDHMGAPQTLHGKRHISDIAKSGDMAGLTFEGYFVDAVELSSSSCWH